MLNIEDYCIRHTRLLTYFHTFRLWVDAMYETQTYEICSYQGLYLCTKMYRRAVGHDSSAHQAR